MIDTAFPKPSKTKLGGDEYKKFIEFIFTRDSWVCRKCGSRKALTPHHLVKRSQLGSDTPRNVLTLCLPCHEEVERNELKIEVVDVVVTFRVSGIDG
jgi:5-methylcytosine-specific restriction endonuclease McrA